VAWRLVDSKVRDVGVDLLLMSSESGPAIPSASGVQRKGVKRRGKYGEVVH